MAGIGPDEIDVVQVQDTESGAEIMHLAECGFVRARRAGGADPAGETEIGGRLPVNTDGGCIANGEPIGASGLRQVYEYVAPAARPWRRPPGARRAADGVHPRLRRARASRRCTVLAR